MSGRERELARAMEEAEMEPDAWLRQWPHLHSQFTSLIASLSRREIRGSFACALQSVALLRNVVGTCRWLTAKELLSRVRWVGISLVKAQPLELAVGNMLRRVLLIVREEYSRLLRERAALSSADAPHVEASLQMSLQDVLMGGRGDDVDARFETVLPDLKENVIEQIIELYDEVESAREPISAQAINHVHASDVILTLGNSRSVRSFLRAAANKSRQFEVFVAETAPSLEGHAAARALAEACGEHISVTVVPESAVFALMARVHKVLLPTRAVMADGALVTPAGGHLVALAAREHAVPVLCVTGLYKLCPTHPHDPDAWNDLGNPAAILPYHAIPDNPCANPATAPRVDVANPAVDHIPPDLVDLYITNTGAHQPSYIYRLLAELYSPDDYDLGEL